MTAHPILSAIVVGMLLLCTTARADAPVANGTNDPAPSRGPLVDLPDQPPLYQSDFADVGYGQFPPGWCDRIERRPSRNWVVDGKRFFRPVLKNDVGLVTYDGALANGSDAGELRDVLISAKFKKTEEPDVFFGLAIRVRDNANFYAARFSGDSRLELHKIKNGQSTSMGNLVSLRRYRMPTVWTITLAARGDEIAAVLHDESGREMARVDGRDNEFKSGAVGLNASTFGAAEEVQIRAMTKYSPALSSADITQRNAASVPESQKYRVLKPLEQFADLHTPFTKLADGYDIIIAGAGTGGAAAAVQAARLGAKVLLLEETDWIGGQMCAAAVSTMDEEGLWEQFPVRERGIYREFNEAMVTYYRTLDKDPFNAYYGVPQIEGGFEPRIARAGLYALIADARKTGAIDISLRSRVIEVHKDADTVTAATIEAIDDSGTHTKRIASKILIDATEYGDVIPLTGARYRVGNVTSDSLDMNALVQDHTWTAQICEYPDGIPEHLKIKSPPPGYDEHRRQYFRYRRYGKTIWGGVAKDVPGPRTFHAYFAWRGVADSDSPLTGKSSEARHTQCGINGGNDYPVTVATIEDSAQRARDERHGIYLTLGTIYYFQHELGVNWSLDTSEGYDMPANRAKMKQLDLRPDLEALAVHLPQMPYVRESRRIIGMHTLAARDMGRFEKARHWPTAVAMGDYFMDLHNTLEAIEVDLDGDTEYVRGGGPFQVPFEVFIPEKVDGFIPAEKNISQSRLVSGATRLQPITMLTGQAAGTIAALSAKHSVQPRNLDVIEVQSVLLDSGCALVQRWYNDVRWNTPIWRATQLLTLHHVMDRPGPVDSNSIPLGSKHAWGVDEPLAAKELAQVAADLARVKGIDTSTPTSRNTVSRGELIRILAGVHPAWKDPAQAAAIANEQSVTCGEFALLAAQLLINTSASAR